MKIAFLGTGYMAEELCEMVEMWNLYEVAGFIDGNTPKGSLVNGYRVLGNDDDVLELYGKGIFDCIFIAIGYTKFDIREKLYNQFKGKVPFANLISPSAYIHPTAKLGEGILLSSGVYISTRAIIEDNVSITLRSIVNHGGHVKKHTYFSTGVTTAGNVTIGERCFVGVGVTVSDGITICDDVWLSPGAVVVKDIKEPGQYISQSTKLYNIK
jgi:sugar O-acyltransferase (sialic acid O-acetyltransferase NeuD family)